MHSNEPPHSKTKITQSAEGVEVAAQVPPKAIHPLDDPNVPKFLLDTNVILAYLNPKAPFHLEAKTAIEGLKTKNVYFVIPYLVIGELIAHRDLIRGKCSVADALSIVSKFDESLRKRFVGGTPLNLATITTFYQRHSRHRKLTVAGFSDFVILAEAEEIKNVRILTCDALMHSCGKSIFGDRIYYLPNRTKGIRSDYPRLMRDIQNDFR